jgi:hypothetical protein
LSIKISNEDSLDKDININGKEELVEKIKTLIDEVRIKERTFTLETVKNNVHRNFDMNWLNEQIDNLRKIKIGSDFVLVENIKDAKVDDQYKAEILNHFAKKLHEIKKIGSFEFDYDPSEGIFKFIDDDDDIVVKATPFFNDASGIPIEVFDEEQSDSHIFIEQRDFNIEDILFGKYREIMEKFLVDDIDDWIGKVDKFDEEKGTIRIGIPDSEDAIYSHILFKPKEGGVLKIDYELLRNPLTYEIAEYIENNLTRNKMSILCGV